MSDAPTSSSASEPRIAALQAIDWLRDRYPLARLSAVAEPSDEAIVAVRVDVIVPDGPGSSAHGSALSIEDAEDRALVRAVEGLGYRPQQALATPAPAAAEPELEPPMVGTRSVFDEPIPPDLPPRPQAVPHEPAREPATRPQAVPNEPTREPANRPPAAPAPLAGRSAQMGPPVMVRPRQPAPQTPQRPAQARGGLRPVPDPGADDPRLEDVSWTEFWKWARAQGFDSRDAVNEAIGRTMDGMTPREVRDLLRNSMGDDT